MKKSLAWITIFTFIVVMAVGLTFVGCQEEAAATEEAAEATEEAATEEAAEEAVDTVEEATEAVVAGETELKDEYRLVQIPILVQSWFDQVFNNSVKADSFPHLIVSSRTIWLGSIGTHPYPNGYSLL